MKKKKTHEQFLKELILKNDEYRNGEFEVVSKYECSQCKMLVCTKFGLCDVVPNNLLKGNKPTIESAVDKTEFFKNMCTIRFENNNDDLSDIEYVKSDLKIKVKCKVSNEYYYTTPHDYYSGRRSSKSGRIRVAEAMRLDQDCVFEKIKELHPDLELLPNQVYKSYDSHLLFSNKYGVVKSRTSTLLKGYIPSIRSAVNPTEYFINQAREVHGNKYDYSLVDYKNGVTKVKIIGPNGIFEQSPSNHLNGQGCPIEGFNKTSRSRIENPTGWTYTKWEAAAKRSKRFTGYKVYFIECWDDETDERFFKIGRTFVSINKRFGWYKSMPYSYKILNVVESDDAREICELEQFYKNENKEFLYEPFKKFDGMNECFFNLKNFENKT